MSLVRIAINRKTLDRWPVYFRPDCERTYFDCHGRDEGLAEMMIRLAKHGYELLTVGQVEEFLKCSKD